MSAVVINPSYANAVFVGLFDGPNSQWIGPDPTLADEPFGAYHYRLQFLLCCTNAAELHGRMAADSVAAVYLNSHFVANIPGYTTWTPISVTSGFVGAPLLNTLDIYVTNNDTTGFPSFPATAFRAEVTNCISPLLVFCSSNKTVPCGSNWTFDLPRASSCCGSNVATTAVSTVTNGVGHITFTGGGSAANGVVDFVGNTATSGFLDITAGTNMGTYTLSPGSGSNTLFVWDGLIFPTSNPFLDLDGLFFTNSGVEINLYGNGPGSYSLVGAPPTFEPLVTNGVATLAVCSQMITRTWLVTDACGNSNTCSQTVTVTIAPPVIVCSTNKTIPCTSNVVFDLPIVESPCCGTNYSITIYGNDVTTTITNASGTNMGPCAMTSTRTWLITDCCEQTNFCHQTITQTTPTSYTITLQPGYNLIANQLDNPAGNTADVLFPNSSGQRDGDVIYIYNCTNATFTAYKFDSFSPTGFSDQNGNPVPAPTLAPGGGAFYDNLSGLPEVVTFTGTPPCPAPPAALPCPCGTRNLVSRTTDCLGTYENITGLTPQPGAQLFRWNGAGYTAYTFGSGGWSPSTPIMNVGEAVFITIPCPCLEPFCMATVLTNFTSPTGYQGTDTTGGVTVQVTNAQPPLGSSNYLQANDLSGPSVIYVGGMAGDYLCSNACYSLCYDFKVFNDGTSPNPPSATPLNIHPAFQLVSDTASGLFIAQWTANMTVTEDGGTNSGWHHICAPIAPLNSNGTLPSNGNGVWQMIAGANSDWNGLLSQVTAVKLNFDYTSSQDEEVGYANFCLTTNACECLQITCPTNKTVACIPCPIGIGQPVSTVLWSFPNTAGPDGHRLYSGVFVGNDGALYGTAFLGGNNGAGTVYKVNTDGSGFSPLHQFAGPPNDSQMPFGGVIEASDGALYGTTFGAGPTSSDLGVVYKMNRNGSGFQLLHSFTGAGGDGKNSYAALLQGRDGALYGTTLYGGNSGEEGTVFKLNPNGSGYTVLHGFGSVPNDGIIPIAGLVQGNDGALYGTTENGGSYGSGVAFKLNTDGTGYAVLHSFGSGEDGQFPQAALVQGSDGVLYGTAEYGGTSLTNCDPFLDPFCFGDGTVFKLNPDGSGYMVLHNFTGPSGDGANPIGGLVQGCDGELYGTTQTGGINDEGTVFKLNTDGSGYSVVKSFAGYDGVNPAASLTTGGDGALYGTTANGGGNNGDGTVFKLSWNSWSFDTPTVVDPCCSNYTMTFTAVTNSGPCPKVITGTWHVTDCASNSATCSQIVTVVNTNPPVIICPSNIVVASCVEIQQTYAPLVTDACCTNLNVVCTPPSGSYFAPGTTTTVNCVATDCCSNTASCSFTVTVQLGTNCCPAVGTILLNTGYNQNSNTVYGIGAADAFWWVTRDPTVPAATLPRPATVILRNPAWQLPQPNSQWISSYPTEEDNLNGEYDFETYFCLTTNASNVVVSVCLRADDAAGAYLNGHQITLLPADTTFKAASPACGTASMGLNPAWFLLGGQNVLQVRVTNIYAVAMGLNLAGSVTGTGLSVETASCCRPASGISGQKFHDLNGNGVRDPGEPARAGWTINLSGGATAVTDVNGYYYFQNLAAGTYTVTEVPQSGWTQTAPAGGSYTVTLGVSQQVNGRDFGNYRTNDTNCVHIFCPSNIVAECTGSGAVVPFTVTATSLCTTNPPVVTCTPPSTTLFPVGSTLVHCTAEDSLGDWATCSFTVTVQDTTPPVITCPSNIVIVTCSTNVPVGWSVTATDMCSSVTVTSSPPSGTIFHRDTTNIVTVVATDGSGNTNTCSFLVIVRKPTLNIAISGSGLPVTVTITWLDGGTLLQADSVLGPWTDIPLATSPYTTTASASQKFYRLRCP
jgi:uncharacterized repeat protein (TIGR03803 family)